MSFSLPCVVPWGRPFEDYISMFSLSPVDLTRRILGCGDGPANFNKILTSRGGTVISLDPLYCHSSQEIQRAITSSYSEVMAKVRENLQDFVWERIASPEELATIRLNAMNDFLLDFPLGCLEGRYVTGALPKLPLKPRTFDLALCSHLLFLYSEQFSEEFHLASIRELCRVSREVRIFPLLEMGGRVSRHFEGVMAQLEHEGFGVRKERVEYEFQKGGNKMLRVRGFQSFASQRQ